jgi:serine/threonine-protein kinase
MVTERYSVDGELGRGGMAVVYRGRDEALDRPVALKVLAEHLAANEEFRVRFMREARIAGSLHHPNLVRVFDITELDGLPCIVMELVEGGTLDGGMLTTAEAAQVAEGLAHAHAQGVVHRDLKPGNLLRSADGTVKIADFGIARAAEETSVTEIGTVLGTLRYLAPEQAEGREVGPAADIYSLGVVLDELLAERPPAVRDALERCRASDPELRPTAAELADLLRAATLPLTARTQVLRRPSSYVQRRLRPVALGLVLLLIAIGVAIAVAMGGGSSRTPAKQPAVAPVRTSADPAQQARNLAAWLRRYSG